MIPISVVIPARNEAQVIERCLRALHAGAEESELETVVVCNGCTDDTASVARRACPSARIIELPQGSKPAALNEGDRATTRFPRFYVDADVEVGIDALRDVGAVLHRGEALCAAPRPVFALDGRPWIIRAYYRTWERLPYLKEEMVGTGVYALAADGRARFGRFPNLTADDQFVLEQFTRRERRSVQSATFTVHPPRTVRGLVQIRRRAYRGARELRAVGPGGAEPRSSSWRAALKLAQHPQYVPELVVYLAVSVVARTLGTKTRTTTRWERDDSARHAA